MASGKELSAEECLLEAAAVGDMQTISRLLDDGVDVCWQDACGMSAAMKAADGGHAAAVEALLEAGCPWNLQDKDGYCAGTGVKPHWGCHAAS